MTTNGASAIDESFVPTRANSVHTVSIDGEAILLDETTARLHRLNPTAALVWACFDGASSLSEIARDVSVELDVPRDEVVADSLALVRDLVDQRLLVAPSPPR
jgi:Coenzyme PQQ synthesis protein D (PqqD)